MKSELTVCLTQAVAKLSFAVDAEKLAAYLMLLLKWNKAYNLTAIRQPEDMVIRHIVDSLSIVPWIKGNSLLDVGTGAGLPGIPIGIACPTLAVTLLDSNGKKIRFLQEVKRSLNLDNITIVEARVENYHPEQAFDTVISRAFSEITQMLQWTQHLIDKEGVWLAMKGPHPEQELRALANVYEIKRYVLTEKEGERCCVMIHPQ